MDYTTTTYPAGKVEITAQRGNGVFEIIYSKWPRDRVVVELSEDKAREVYEKLGEWLHHMAPPRPFNYQAEAQRFIEWYETHDHHSSWDDYRYRYAKDLIKGP